jgi:hypothetical protein
MVDVASEGRNRKQKPDWRVKRDLPSDQIESRSATLEASSGEFLDHYLSWAERSRFWSRSGSFQPIAPIEGMP